MTKWVVFPAALLLGISSLAIAEMTRRIRRARDAM
jgi:hypothetical protein